MLQFRINFAKFVILYVLQKQSMNHISVKRPRCYAKSPTVHAGCISVNTRPLRLQWGDQEMETAISCTECSHVAGLIQKVGRHPISLCNCLSNIIPILTKSLILRCSQTFFSCISEPKICLFSCIVRAFSCSEHVQLHFGVSKQKHPLIVSECK